MREVEEQRMTVSPCTPFLGTHLSLHCIPSMEMTGDELVSSLHVTVSLPINLRHDHRMSTLLQDLCKFYPRSSLNQNLSVADFLLTVKLSVCLNPLNTGYLSCTSQHHKPKMLAPCKMPLSLSIALLMVKKEQCY